MPWPPLKIERIGIEVEGGWDKPPKHPMHVDGSVQIRANYVGELSSKIMKVEPGLKWLARPDIYPDYVDASCGLHVHLSFRQNNDIAGLGDSAFYDAFLQHMADWGTRMNLANTHPFWSRLRGDQEYCQKKFIFSDQMKGLIRVDPDCRRTHINACSYKTHGTIECRMLPMFSEWKLGVKAVKDYIEFVDDWLESNKKVRESEVVSMKYDASEPETILIEHVIR